MSKGGEKFTAKYGVRLASSFASAPENPRLEIPPKGHALYDADGSDVFDEAMVREIDEDGRCVGTIVVFADPDSGTLWVVEGRGRLLSCIEANRRRRERGDEPIEIEVSRFPGDMERAAEHVRLRNFHRKVPTLSHTAREIAELKRRGKTWERIAQLLHLPNALVPKADEEHLRILLPLAFCEPEVCEVFDARKMPLRHARQFGGGAIDGTEALGRKAQLALLTEKQAKRESKEPGPRPVGPKRASLIREQLLEAGEKGYAAFVAFLQGDEKALAQLPATVRGAVKEAMGTTVKGPKGKGNSHAEAAA